MESKQAQNPMQLKLSEERKQLVLSALGRFFSEEFDEELSPYRGERILAFFLKSLGPPLYNQAISDARSFMLRKLDDLDVEFYQPEEPV
jgi:uncharacterized protein (DUF2164 family)